MSRAKLKTQINFGTLPKVEDESFAFDSYIRRKIAGHTSVDAAKGRETDVDVEYITDLVERQQNRYAHCNKEMTTKSSSQLNYSVEGWIEPTFGVFSGQ